MQKTARNTKIREGKDLPPKGSTPDDGKIRLDLAAGHFREQGWVAVDLADGYAGAMTNPEQPDVVADVRDLPFPDDYADEARAIHIIEHFHAWEALDVVKEWVRVLKPGGKLAIECPGLEKVLKLAEVPQIQPKYTYWALYGDPRHQRPEMMHKWCYTSVTLARLMAQAGLEDITPEPPQFHYPVRDIRVVGNKPLAGNSIILPGRE
jgi:predicted SAM-dependent methyltransferase